MSRLCWKVGPDVPQHPAPSVGYPACRSPRIAGQHRNRSANENRDKDEDRCRVDVHVGPPNLDTGRAEPRGEVSVWVGASVGGLSARPVMDVTVRYAPRRVNRNRNFPVRFLSTLDFKC